MKAWTSVATFRVVGYSEVTARSQVASRVFSIHSSTQHLIKSHQRFLCRFRGLTVAGADILHC